MTVPLRPSRAASPSTSRTIQRKVLSDGEFRARVIARGAPPQVADFSLSFYLAARHGEFNVVDPTLERLIGRPPTTMRALISRSASA